ncbi:PQQ-dependent sugar dehydrogenase [Marinococcus luteus]|uniref:PQQ-dependent sugar dehydrogenase n=1 Tax=Marinococcus luteus TaxID=1122204 RepID=UPI002ACCAA03|nr:sorbosone dehydrogenase family protein [Marinococcus luteus]MDZ5783391.1 sorbosone dehydrogenase family protein [Marinococcus luteus]
MIIYPGRKTTLSLLIFGAALLAGCSSGENDEQSEENAEEPAGSVSEAQTEDWDVEVVAENLEVPWSLNIHEDTYYMTNRGGEVIEVNGEETERLLLNTSDEVANEGEGGLLGFVLAEDFTDSQEGYAYYTYRQDDGALANRVVAVERETSQWNETEVLLDHIPGNRIHNGGRLELGPDGYLYATAGDSDEPSLAQDKDSLAGSILRMTVEGEVPEDNPFENSYVYSYGHRNPQGLAWNSDGHLYSSEHGPNAQDEINVIEPGNNYGWPEITGSESAEGLKTPTIQSGSTTWAPSGTAFFRDTLLTAGLRGESLYAYDEETEEMNAVFDGEGRLRDVKTEDGNVYVLTNNTDGRGTPAENDDRLLRLTPEE